MKQKSCNGGTGRINKNSCMFLHTAIFCVSIEFKYGGDPDKSDRNGDDIPYHNGIVFFVVEFSGKLHLVNNIFHAPEVPDEHTGKDCGQRHQHTVCDEINQVKKIHSKQPNLLPNAKAERTGNAENKCEKAYAGSCFYPSELELVNQESDKDLHQ